ncbi:hypothetical protein ACFVXA_03245 [Streptomyces sp. NPDC058246]|uniref:POT-type proton-dependent oligopeptide transporter n=1 Tax=Streptomyces sp. NPDC058246 TaxID=3346400 RepID=UPI0036E5ADFF
MSRSAVDTEPGSRPPPADDHAFLGRPRGLLTLSGLEVWERFSFLGMRAILVLYFADTGGRDRRRRARGHARVAVGEAVPTAAMTWAGPGLISAGTGLLEPCEAGVAAVVVGGVELADHAIDIGAFAGPLITGRLGDHQGRDRGFSAAAIGMTSGPIPYAAARRHLAGRRNAAEFALAPVVAALRVRMGHSRPHASIGVGVGVGVAIGVALGCLSFLLMALRTRGHSGQSGQRGDSDDDLMSAWWIVGPYPLLGLGDVLLETSGMSATTKLAPAAFAGQTMSLWFLSLALAGGIQAQTVKRYDDVSEPACSGVNGAIAVAAGLAVMALVALAPWLRRTMHPVH